MSESSSNRDALLVELGTLQARLCHEEVSARLHADDYEWRIRAFEWPGLVVSPSIAVAFLATDSPQVRSVAGAIAGLCGLGSWAAMVTGLLMRWKDIIRVLRGIAFESEALFEQLNVIRKRILASDTVPADAESFLVTVRTELTRFTKERQNENIATPPWLKLVAIQTSLYRTTGVRCRGCNRTFASGESPLTKQESKRFLRKMKRETHCMECGRRKESGDGTDPRSDQKVG